MLKELAVFIIASTVAFLVVLYLLSPSSVATLTAQLLTAGTTVITVWNSLDNNVKLLGIGGLTTAITLFMTWTKTRAVTQMQQAQQQATTVAFDNTQLNQQVGALQTQVTTANTKLAALQHGSADVAELIASRDEAQRLLTNAQSELETQRQRHLIELNTLQSTIERLQRTVVEVVK